MHTYTHTHTHTHSWHLSFNQLIDCLCRLILLLLRHSDTVSGMWENGDEQLARLMVATVAIAFAPSSEAGHKSLVAWANINPLHLMRTLDDKVQVTFLCTENLATTWPGIYWLRPGLEWLYTPLFDLRMLLKNILGTVASDHLVYPAGPLSVTMNFTLFASADVCVLVCRNQPAFSPTNTCAFSSGPRRLQRHRRLHDLPLRRCTRRTAVPDRCMPEGTVRSMGSPQVLQPRPRRPRCR